MEFKQVQTYIINPSSTPTALDGSMEDNVDGAAAHTSRINKINEIQQNLEREREMRAMLSKKYKRGVKIISTVADSLIITSIGFGVVGTVVLSTIIATPIAIATTVGTVVLGLLSVVGSHVNKKFDMKAEKHEKIKTFADTKLNTNSGHISKALNDEMVSDEEYSLILSELENFNSMKEKIRSKIKVEIDEQTKNSLIEQSRTDAIKRFVNEKSEHKNVKT